MKINEIYDFGDNHKYLLEIFDLLESKKFIQGKNKPIENEYETSNLKKAIKSYRSENHRIPELFPNRKKLVSMYLVDNRLLEINTEKVYENRNRFKMHTQLDELYLLKNSFVGKSLEKVKLALSELKFRLYSQLDGCIYNMAMEGNSNLYYTRMIEAYKTGGWPCGFTGTWPDVKFKIYYPINESPHAK